MIYWWYCLYIVMLAMNNLLCNYMSLNEGNGAHCIIGQSREHTDTNDWLSLWIQQYIVYIQHIQIQQSVYLMTCFTSIH